MQLRCEAEHTEEQILIEMDSSLEIDLVPGVDGARSKLSESRYDAVISDY